MLISYIICSGFKTLLETFTMTLLNLYLQKIKISNF